MSLTGLAAASAPTGQAAKNAQISVRLCVRASVLVCVLLEKVPSQTGGLKLRGDEEG